MKLYKNVDIKDLASICKDGILPANVCKNFNWEDGKRGNGSQDVVYLAKYIGELNTACQYGLALIEIEIDESEVKENPLTPYDINADLYEEYICDEVRPDQIAAIYVPEVVKEYVGIPEEIENKITWCGMAAKLDFGYKLGLLDASETEIKNFVSMVKEFNACGFNFFRAYTPENTVADIYKIKYIF